MFMNMVLFEGLMENQLFMSNNVPLVKYSLSNVCRLICRSVAVISEHLLCAVHQMIQCLCLNTVNKNNGTSKLL